MIEVSEPVVLDDVQQRVLGCLIEKERATPETYPLTLNAVRLACNQSSAREPVVSYDESVVVGALDELKALGLCRHVHPRSGRGVIKFRHVVDELPRLEPEGVAVLGVLLLRGPQTAGELRTRTERLHPFESVEAVEQALSDLAARTTAPLARRLERRPGEREARWIHLLGPVDESAGGSLDPPPRAESRSQSRSEPQAVGPTEASRLEALEQEVRRLAGLVDEMRRALGLDG